MHSVIYSYFLKIYCYAYIRGYMYTNQSFIATVHTYVCTLYSKVAVLQVLIYINEFNLAKLIRKGICDQTDLILSHLAFRKILI